MSQELLYTSAPQGLKPGSYGFCTVLATEGLPKVLQDRLESLSGYEHPFALTDQRAAQNPVNYSHLVATVANRRVHLLSRIADAGADYSGRSNKIAHHLVLETSELFCASPADVLAAPGLFKSSFDGAPHWLPPGTPPRLPTPAFSKCDAWAALSSRDAGWAGVLAQRTLKEPTKPITLIFAPGTEVLPLVAEALSLLPPDVRWRTTFSTFFTKLPAGIDCQWRFVLDGTPAALQARRNLQAPPIDLVSSVPTSETGPLIDAARSGQAPAAAATTSTPARSVVVPQLPSRAKSAEDGSETYRLGSPVTRPAGNAAGNLPAGDLFGKPKASKRALIFAGIGGLAVLTIAVGVMIWTLSRQTEPLPVVAAADKTEQVPEEEIEKPDALKAAELDAAKHQTVQADLPTTSVAITDAPPEETPKEEVPKTPLLPVFKNIEAKGKTLSLPKLGRGLSEESTGPHELCKIYVENPLDCKLALVTAETFDGEQRLRLVPQTEPTPGQRAWTVQAHTKKTAVEGSKAVDIGEFVLHDASQDHALTFAWAKAPPDWANPFGLAYCKLNVEVGDDHVACQLSKPVIVTSEKLRLKTRGDKIPISIPADSLASFDKVRFDLELARGDWFQGVTQIAANDSTVVKLRIPGESEDGTGDVEFEFRFLPPGKSSAEFACAAFVFPASLGPTNSGWKRDVKRVDQLESQLKDAKVDFKVREGVVQADLDRMRKLTTVHDTRANKQINGLEGEIAKIDRRLKELANAEKPTKEEIEEANGLSQKKGLALQGIKTWKELIQFGQEFNSWTLKMKSHLQELEKTVEVRYSVYLDFGDERAVIAQTERVPRREKPEADANKDQSE